MEVALLERVCVTQIATVLLLPPPGRIFTLIIKIRLGLTDTVLYLLTDTFN